MAVITKEADLAKLRTSGQISAQALAAVAAIATPGVTTQILNDEAERVIRQAGGQPAFLGYQDFPATLCTSINDEVVHGIPSAKRVLADGDLVGLDIGVNYQGLFSDTAVTVGVGRVPEQGSTLMARTKLALDCGLAAVRPGARVGDISFAIEQFLKPFGYGIVRQLTGHGLGYAVHEPPSIPNFGEAGTGQVLEVGMVLAIEPMVTIGGYEVVTAEDGWTVVTKDHSLAAHFEHTILVTPDGCEIITQIP